ncbi:MAG: hypothetical protein D6694_13520 [Gammaproteobacteria bacterium]|nr:MAG: hypothetical protein D6694_13520 [Gammaproteobacteria bacterium]
MGSIRRVRKEYPGGGRIRLILARLRRSRLAVFVLAEAKVMLACLRFLTVTRRYVPDSHDPDSFSAWRNGNYRMLAIPGSFLLLFVDLPILLFLASLVSGGGAVSANWAIHGGLFLAGEYAIFWLWGDWQLIKETAHRLEEKGLRIALGIRWRGLVPYDAVSRVEFLTDTESSFDPVREGRLTISPWKKLDRPNVRLVLDNTITLFTLFDRARRARILDLYLDDPGRFIGCLMIRVEGVRKNLVEA